MSRILYAIKRMLFYKAVPRSIGAPIKAYRTAKFYLKNRNRPRRWFKGF